MTPRVGARTTEPKDDIAAEAERRDAAADPYAARIKALQENIDRATATNVRVKRGQAAVALNRIQSAVNRWGDELGQAKADQQKWLETQRQKKEKLDRETERKSKMRDYYNLRLAGQPIPPDVIEGLDPNDQVKVDLEVRNATEQQRKAAEADVKTKALAKRETDLQSIYTTTGKRLWGELAELGESASFQFADKDHKPLASQALKTQVDAMAKRLVTVRSQNFDREMADRREKFAMAQADFREGKIDARQKARMDADHLKWLQGEREKARRDVERLETLDVEGEFEPFQESKEAAAVRSRHVQQLKDRAASHLGDVEDELRSFSAQSRETAKRTYFDTPDAAREAYYEERDRRGYAAGSQEAKALQDEFQGRIIPSFSSVNDADAWYDRARAGMTVEEARDLNRRVRARMAGR